MQENNRRAAIHADMSTHQQQTRLLLLDISSKPCYYFNISAANRGLISNTPEADYGVIIGRSLPCLYIFGQ